MSKENWWIEYKRFVKCFSRNIVDQTAIIAWQYNIYIYIYYLLYIYKCNMNILLFIYIYDVDISSRKLSWELPSWELSNQKLSHDKILGLWRSFLVQILKVFAGCQMKKDEPGIQHFIVFRHIRCVFHLMPTSNANSVSGAWRYSYFKLEKLQTFGHDKYLVGKHVSSFQAFEKIMAVLAQRMLFACLFLKNLTPHHCKVCLQQVFFVAR